MLKKKIDIKKISLILIIGFTFSNCMWDDPITAKKVTKDYYLQWVYESSDQILLRSSDEGKSGAIEISETVYAVGYNDKYIIAKQHPNLEREISERLFGNLATNGDYLLENPADTIYLGKDDRIYEQDGKWYHISNGWSPPNSLKNYKKQTFYHIIDITKKTNSNWIFDNEMDYLQKRESLGISEKLEFTIIDKELE